MFSSKSLVERNKVATNNCNITKQRGGRQENSEVTFELGLEE